MFEIKNLRKTYHNRHSDVLALKNLNLKIGEQGIVFLYGQSGEGKSTLLNILSGLDNYDEGSIVAYNGVDIMTMSQYDRDNYRSKEIGLIFEKENFIDCLTVKENIEIAVPLSGYKVDDKIVMEALEKVHLQEFADRKLTELSSGELQRVAIARILATVPRVLFVDEPTGHLDKTNSELFWQIIKQISKNALVIAITHEKEIVDKYADRVIEIKAGEIKKDTYLNEKIKKADEKLFGLETKKADDVKTRANLSFKNNLKLGWKFLTVNPFRLISMLVLITLTLVMFSTSYLIGAFDSSYVIAKSSIKQNLSYVSFENDENLEITDSILNKVYNSNTGEYFKLYTINQNMTFDNGESITFKGMLEAVQDKDSNLNSIGQTVLYGKYPLDTDPNNRIAISDYVARQMLKNGVTFYTLSGQGKLDSNSSLKDIVGKSFVIDKTMFEVTAIFKTNYDQYVDENLDVLDTTDAKENFDYYYNTVYSVMHVVPNKALTTISNKKSAEDVVLGFETNTNSVLPNNYSVVCQDYADDNSVEYNIFGSKEKLTDYEIVLPLNVFNNLYNQDFADISDDVMSSFQVAVNNNSNITLTSNFGYVKEYTIVGLTSGNKIIFANTSVDAKGRFDEISKHCVYPVMHLVVKVTDEDKLSTQIDLMLETNLNYTGRYSDEILGLTSLVSNLNIVFIVSTIFMTIFSIWLMFTFFVSFASTNRRSIGALRTMGANSLNIFVVFAISCLIVALISLACGMGLSTLTSVVLNSIISSRFGLPISVFNLNFGMFGYMILISVVITVLGAIVPVSRYCRKTPVDVVKR